MQLQFLGCGDAFGSGGRFNTCFMVTGTTTRFLIDCGASSMIAMKRFGVDPNSIDAVLITHLHGDHFGGLPFLLLDAQHMSRRTRPLVVVGPKTLRKRLSDTMECLFPGSTGVPPRFDLRIEEFPEEEGAAWRDGAISVSPYRVKHYCGAPPYALRVECEDRTVTYTGDTEWVDALIPAARDADLFIAEAYFREKQMKFHLNYETLMAHIGKMRPKRLVLTHMSPDMLGQAGNLPVETAEDGKVVTF